MSCDVSTDEFLREDSELDISDKYVKLMQDTMCEESIYDRAKETIFYQFEDLQLTEKEKAGFVVDFVAKLTTELSKSSMAIALSWAKEERDGAYNLAAIKAQVENSTVSVKKTKEEVCLVQAQVKKVCADIEATIASSIRENGAVTGYDPNNPCKPAHLDDTGLKYQQTRQVEADMYKIYADAYRKSGVVSMGSDPQDGFVKGLNGTTHSQVGELAGYTTQQTANAERQRIAYEDSKRNHAANSSASMIGQLLAAETFSNENDQDVQRWRNAVDYLNSSYSTTPA